MASDYVQVRQEQGRINSVDEITAYHSEDVDAVSRSYQVLQRVGGLVIMAACFPLAVVGAGPTKVVREGFRGAKLQYGKLVKILQPGSYSYNPVIEKIERINVQIQTLIIPRQNVITKDGIQTMLDAVCYFRVFNVERAVFAVQDYLTAMRSLAQFTLEVLLGEHSLNDILQNRKQITMRMTDIMEEQSQAWGLHVTGLEIRDVTIPLDLVRVMAASAEAAREGEAKIIGAEAELKAAENYARAATELAKAPGALQLRYFQTLVEISSDKNSTIIVPSGIEKAAGAMLGGLSSSQTVI